MSNSHKDDFERMMRLAEFGASRHNERRQVEFRVFISYTTLLAFAVYQVYKNNSFDLLNNNSPWIIGILSLVHILYILWEIRLSMAMDCDTSRRDFYTAKAQCLLEHLLKQPDETFYPCRDVPVTMKHSKVKSCCPKKDKVYESELFEMHEPSFEIPSPTWKVLAGWKQIIDDWSRAFQVFVPTVMISLVFLKEVDKDTDGLKIVFALSPIIIVFLLAIISKLLDYSIKKDGLNDILDLNETT
ncbi:MAG: hypothetical protein OXH00_26230 [Candidatus Poribacteria bacterium]|nr:hypothetical protein [Candidatus Poribacteria bacterium]